MNSKEKMEVTISEDNIISVFEKDPSKYEVYVEVQDQPQYAYYLENKSLWETLRKHIKNESGQLENFLFKKCEWTPTLMQHFRHLIDETDDQNHKGLLKLAYLMYPDTNFVSY